MHHPQKCAAVLRQDDALGNIMHHPQKCGAVLRQDDAQGIMPANIKTLTDKDTI
jgi:hypothetical protein